MRFHILGMGPVGSLVAFHLRRTLNPKHHVNILHKSERYKDAAVRKRGVWLENNGVMLTALGFDHEVFDPQANGEDIESLIVTTKAYSSPSSIRQLASRLTPQSTIVLMHNGMGVYERIIEEVYPHPGTRPHFVLAVNNHGAWLKDHLHVVHAGVGNIKFGIVSETPGGRDFEASLQTGALSLDDIAYPPEDTDADRYLSLRNTIAALLRLTPLNTSWLPIYDVQMAMRIKLVVNSFINPATALLGCTNGEIMQHIPGKELCKDICTEASAAFQAQWEAERREAEESGAGGEETEFPKELSAEALMSECRRVVYTTSGNYSSMLTDVRLARPTEVQYMNGYLVRLGMSHGLPMSVNRTMLRLATLRSKIPLPKL